MVGGPAKGGRVALEGAVGECAVIRSAALFRGRVAGEGAVDNQGVQGFTPDTAARLLEVCRLMVLEPWAGMAAAPVGAECFDVCARLDPRIEALHHQVAVECIAAILGDEPSRPLIERRLQILVDLQILVERFVPPEIPQ